MGIELQKRQLGEWHSSRLVPYQQMELEREMMDEHYRQITARGHMRYSGSWDEDEKMGMSEAQMVFVNEKAGPGPAEKASRVIGCRLTQEARIHEAPHPMKFRAISARPLDEERLAARRAARLASAKSPEFVVDDLPEAPCNTLMPSPPPTPPPVFDVTACDEARAALVEYVLDAAEWTPKPLAVTALLRDSNGPWAGATFVQFSAERKRDLWDTLAV